MHILLLKEPRDGESGPDPYIKVDTLYPNALVLLFCSTGFIHEYTAVVSAALHFKCFTFHCKFWEDYIILISQELASHGHKATLIPVLSFKFVSLNTLSDKVNSILSVLNWFHFVFLLLPPVSCICCLKSLSISAFPTRKTRRSYIYQSKSSGGCEDVLGSRRKKGRWEEPTEMHFKHVIIVAPCTSLNAYQFCVLHFWTPNRFQTISLIKCSPCPNYYFRVEQFCERQVEHQVHLCGWEGNCCTRWVIVTLWKHISLKIVFSFIVFHLCGLCFFFINPCYVNANSSRVWQAPGVVVTEVCEVMLPPWDIWK